MKNKKAGCVYGYVRVSSADQNEERQRITKVIRAGIRVLDMSGIGRTTFYKKLKEFSA